jgi:hypothetical protein
LENDIFDPATELESVVLYPADRRPASIVRTASRTICVRGRPRALRDIWLADLYDQSATDDDVIESLRLELA